MEMPKGKRSIVHCVLVKVVITENTPIPPPNMHIIAGGYNAKNAYHAFFDVEYLQKHH